jgi:hypothetical protein
LKHGQNFIWTVCLHCKVAKHLFFTNHLKLQSQRRRLDKINIKTRKSQTGIEGWGQFKKKNHRRSSGAQFILTRRRQLCFKKLASGCLAPDWSYL